MDVESGDMLEVSSLQKPTSLPLRRSNNKMMNNISGTTGNSDRKLVKSLDVTNENSQLVVQTEVSIIDETSTPKKESKPDDVKSAGETCAVFGQIIDNEDESWDIFSNATSWESSFPKDILSECSSIGSAIVSDAQEHLPPDWKKVSDSGGSYYWNLQSGKTQLRTPEYDENEDNATTDLSPEDNSSLDDSQLDTSRDGHMFVVRSLGWLPMDSNSLKPDVSSASVNACIRHLSNNRTQLMDGVGVWGEGKDLMLQINADQLKIVDPSKDTLLQTQPIRHIRLWGVGRDSSFDFAYVVRSPTTKLYQCHVFRCDTPAQAIAKQVHSICAHLVKEKKSAKRDIIESNNGDNFPVAASEPSRIFQAQYVGSIIVNKATGIEVVKGAISDLTENSDVANLQNVSVAVSASALKINEADETIVNCRMRYLSFMGVGDNIEFFGFISVISNQPMCYVLRCEPNAAKLAVAVQEACMLRYQKAIDSKQCEMPRVEPKRSKSLKSKVAKLFSGFRTSES